MLEQNCPVYVSFGMTPEQYWEGDPQWAVWYRKAQRLRNEQANREAWLHGLYVYEAICAAHPLFNPYAKQGTKPKPYPEQPHELFKPGMTEEQRREDAELRKAAQAFQARVDQINARIRQRKQGGEKT